MDLLAQTSLSSPATEMDQEGNLSRVFFDIHKNHEGTLTLTTYRTTAVAKKYIDSDKDSDSDEEMHWTEAATERK